jgi:hypothetical protein
MVKHLGGKRYRTGLPRFILRFDLARARCFLVRKPAPDRPGHVTLTAVNGYVMHDEPSIILSPIQQTAHDAVLRNVIAEIECCCARAEAHSKLVDVFLDLVDVRLTVLGLVRCKVVDRYKYGSLILVKATAYALTRPVSMGYNFIVGDEFR